MPRETKGLPLFDWAEKKSEEEREKWLKARNEDSEDLAPGTGSWGTESAGPFKKTEERVVPAAPNKPREPYPSEIRKAGLADPKKMREDIAEMKEKHGDKKG